MLTRVQAVPVFSLDPRVYALLCKPPTDLRRLLSQLVNEIDAVIFLVQTEHIIFELPLVISVPKDSLSNQYLHLILRYF
jgi:hypothetical protein